MRVDRLMQHISTEPGNRNVPLADRGDPFGLVMLQRDLGSLVARSNQLQAQIAALNRRFDYLHYRMNVLSVRIDAILTFIGDDESSLLD